MHLIGGWTAATRGQKRRLKRQKVARDLMLTTLKNVPCADCGGRFDTEEMDFDHVPGRGTKIKNVSKFTTAGGVMNEARKCDVVCAVCHRRRTRARRVEVNAAKAKRTEKLHKIQIELQAERDKLADTLAAELTPSKPKSDWMLPRIHVKTI